MVGGPAHGDARAGRGRAPAGYFRGFGSGRRWRGVFWSGMGATVFPAFDAMSSTPAKIESFRDFTRSAGPPTVARCGGVLACFFVAGASKTATDVLMASPKAPSSSRVRP